MLVPKRFYRWSTFDIHGQSGKICNFIMLQFSMYVYEDNILRVFTFQYSCTLQNYNSSKPYDYNK